MNLDDTERLVRERVAVLEWRLDELREQLREARADVRSLDEKLDQLMLSLGELKTRPQEQSTSLTTRGVAGMTAGLSTIIAVVVEVVQHLVTK